MVTLMMAMTMMTVCVSAEGVHLPELPGLYLQDGGAETERAV
jgi:hypothetical protein